MEHSKPAFTVQPTIIDRLVSWVNPGAGLSRIRNRATLQALETTGYITPSSSRRSMRGWTPKAGTADQDTLKALPASRAACRDLVMNTPIARGALKRELTNVVGWGLVMQSRIDRELLGLTDEQAEAWIRDTERRFRTWSASTECDIERTLSFYELQSMALYNTSLSGDVFVLLPYVERTGSPMQLRIQFIEGDWVSNPKGAMDTTSIAGGVEVDTNGAPVAYYVMKLNPKVPLSMVNLSANNAFTWERIDAFGYESGRRNVLHLYHKERPGQRRGMPMLAPVVEILKQMSRLTEAELMAAVVSSFFTVFIKTQPTQGGLAEGFIPSEKVSNSALNTGDQNVYEMGSGSIIELGGEGQDISIADPKRPNQAFEPFFLAMVKQIGSALEIPFEQLIMHFDASYSAARGAMLEAWKFYRHRRQWLSRRFCQPVYEAWLEEAVGAGIIKAPGFFNDPEVRAAWCGSYWGGPGQGQIDPLRETQAAQQRIEWYLSTWEDEYTAIHGTDWGTSLKRGARERTMIDENGLPIPTIKTGTSTASGTSGDVLPDKPTRESNKPKPGGVE